MLDGLVKIRPKAIIDERGFFLESFQDPRYQELGIKTSFVQHNHSYSKRGVLRGMHFQPGQAKLIYVVKGSIFDVAVDIRKSSPTFGKWEGVYLNDQNHEQFFIPDGFAHGFLVLSDEAHVLYKVSAVYNSATERGFRYDDPEVGITWPEQGQIISMRDRNAPLMHEVVTL